MVTVGTQVLQGDAMNTVPLGPGPGHRSPKSQQLTYDHLQQQPHATSYGTMQRGVVMPLPQAAS
jgi:hypothetical protein